MINFSTRAERMALARNRRTRFVAMLHGGRVMDGINGLWDEISAGIYTLVGGIIVAVIGFFVQRRKQTLDADGNLRLDLSKSERDFRIDIIAQLKDVRAMLAECQDHREEAVAMNHELRSEVATLRDRVRTLQQRVTGEDEDNA